MATPVQTLIDELAEEYGFDITSVQALRALDRRHKTLVQRAKSRRLPIDVGVTVAGQADYAVSALEIYDVAVDGVPYDKAPRRSQRAYGRGEIVWSPSTHGLFVSTADESAAAQIGLIPPPTTDGLAITAFVAAGAEDLAADGVISVDDDMADALVDGAAATFFARDAEQLGPADRNEQRFDAACEEFRRRVAKRFRGAGPAQIRVAGLNA